MTLDPPLAGVTVVSLEQAVAAPFATRQLADLGARVIKVERPGTGDFARHYDETVHGDASYFVWLNRSKESVTLDLKSDRGRALLGRLLDRADVFVQNLGPGAAERLDLDAATLARTHPRVIPCTISGWGTDGPATHRKAYDLLVQCEAGLLSVTGTPGAMARTGISVADIAAGMYAYSGVLTALLRRATTGVVSAIEVSLFEALAEWMGAPMYYTRYGGSQPVRAGCEHATIAPYGPYECTDATVLLAVQNDREWQSLCTRLLGDPGLAADPRFATNSTRVANRAALNEIIGAALGGVCADSATAELDAAGIANARVNQIADLVGHPVLAGRDRWRDVEVPGGTVRALLPPVDLDGSRPVMGPVPALGAHTDAVLTEIGCDAGEIRDLRASGIV